MDRFQSVSGVFERFRRQSDIPAIAFGVIADGELAYSGGHARSGAERPTGDSVFRIASLTKSFTAASVLLLRDRGRLRLDDAVTEHVAALRDLPCPYPDRWPTLRELLTMAGGLPTDDAWADRMESATDEQFDAMLRDGLRVISEPGVGFSYSNLGYALLGRTIATVTTGTSRSCAAHERYREFVAAEFLKPLQLASTAFSASDVDAAQLVPGYRRGTADWVQLPWSSPGAFSSIGGLFSSVRDLSRWVGFLMGAHSTEERGDIRHLSASSRRELQQAHQFTQVRGGITDTPGLGWRQFACATGYGFGLEVDHDARYGQIIGHPGGYPGYGSYMCWHPESGLGVVALANATYAGPAQAARAALEQLLDQRGPARRPLPVATQLRAAAAAAEALFDEATADRHAQRPPHKPEWDEVFAPNVDLDIPRPERLTQWRSAAAAIGKTEPFAPTEQELGSADAAHVSWRRAGTSGLLKFSLRLTPEAAMRCQTITVTALPAPAAVTEGYVRRILTAVAGGGSWPDDVPVADGFDRATFDREAALAHALIEQSSESDHEFEFEHVLPSPGPERGEDTFRTSIGLCSWELSISLDEQLTGAQRAVRSCRLGITPAEWPG